MVCVFGRAWVLALLACIGAGAAAAPSLEGVLLAPAAAWVEPIAPDESRPVRPESTDARGGVEMLLSDIQVRIGNRTRSTYARRVMRAVAPAGVETIANVEIAFDPSFERLLVHRIEVRRAGRTVHRLPLSALRVLQRERELEALIFDGTRSAHAILPDVRVGDVVDVEYGLEGDNPVFGQRPFGAFQLQGGWPIRRLHARLAVEDGRAVQWQMHAGAPQPQRRMRDGREEFVWDLPDVPGARTDAQVPEWFDAYPYAEWSTWSGWSEVAAWASALYALPGTLPDTVRDQAARIAAQAHAPAERLLAALRFVQGEVRYLGIEMGPASHAPSAPARVLERRFGDCKDKSLLLVALLRELGIEARPLLVHTRLRHATAERLPGPGAFNHAIVQARLDGATVHVDPTRRPQRGRLATIYQPDYGAALVVDPATRALQPMPPERVPARRVKMEIDAHAGLDQPVTLVVRTSMQGAAAEAMRDRLAGGGRDELQQDYLNYYAGVYPGIRVDAPLFVIDEVEANELTLVERYRTDRFWPRVEERMRREAHLVVPDVGQFLREPQETLRRSPLALPHPVDVEQVTVIDLPPLGWKLKDRQLAVDDPAFSYRHAEAFDGRKVTVTDRFRSLADHVPLDRLDGYLENRRRAADAVGYLLYIGDRAAPVVAERRVAGAAVEAAGPLTHRGAVMLERMNWPVALLAAGWFVLLVRAALRIARWQPQPPALPPERHDGGVWLMLVVCGFTVAPLWAAGRLVEAVPVFAVESYGPLTLPSHVAYRPWAGFALLAALAVDIATLVFGALVAAMLWLRLRAVRMVAACYLLGALLADALALALAVGTGQAAAERTAVFWRALAAALVLVPWFLRSRQVAAIFTEAAAAQPAKPAAETMPA